MPEDAAFVWQGGAAPPPRPKRNTAVAPAEPAGVQWATLRDAADAVGVARGTIRRWAAKGQVPTRLADTEHGVRRMVGLAEVRERVAARGSSAPAAAPPPAAPPPAASPSVPDDHLLVPRDAWDKVLAQLGNLHEAGQQLAEARERAAKAETEAAFLRERLAELRDGAGPAPEEVEAPVVAVPPQPRWRRLLRREGR